MKVLDDVQLSRLVSWINENVNSVAADTGTASDKANSASVTASEAQTLAEMAVDAIHTIHGGAYNLAMSGTFSSGSTETDWWWNMGGTKKSIAEFVDPETMAFSIPFGQFTSKDLTSLFVGNTGLEGITVWPFPVRPTTMNGMFMNCTSLSDLNLTDLDTRNVTGMSGTFRNCNNLAGLDLSTWDVSNVETMIGMFDGCTALVNLNLSGLDFRNVKHLTAMFDGCSSLTTVTGTFSNLNDNIDLSACPLTQASVAALFRGLARLDAGTTRFITLNSTVRAATSATVLDVATSRGWTVLAG